MLKFLSERLACASGYHKAIVAANDSIVARTVLQDILVHDIVASRRRRTRKADTGFQTQGAFWTLFLAFAASDAVITLVGHSHVTLKAKIFAHIIVDNFLAKIVLRTASGEW